MKDMKYSEILARNRVLGMELSGEPYRIVLLSNIVATQLSELIEFSLRSSGINARVDCGNYDNIVQECERLNNTNAVIVFWEACNLIDGLHAVADCLEPGLLEELSARVQGEIRMVLSNLRTVPLVLFNRFSALLFTADELRERPLDKLCRELNDCLDSMTAPNVTSIDIDRVIAKVKLDAAADFRQYQSSRALYTIDFLKAYTAHVAPVFHSITGKSRKLIVLDCDNTLWGGILGEDGEKHIEMSNTTRSGRAFREVQQILLGLRKEGVMLALCSKNNPEDVGSVLAGHPDMLLHEEDFVATKINWQDKATNISELASELNIGLDSIVFVEDSSFELGLVQELLPEVKLLKVPEQLFEYPAMIRKARRVFFTISRTAEDARKTELYLEENARSKVAAGFASLDDYLQSLGLKIEVLHNETIPVERASQLTQKTNQFNLTTRRYTESDITRFISDGKHLLMAFSVSDHYGDYGITGLAILELLPEHSDARIDVFLQSCRVLGRNIERAFMDYMVQYLQRLGVSHLQGEFLRTSKNSQAADLYDIFGFELLSHDDEHREYALDLRDYHMSGISYIEVTGNVV